jgi:hypothetical protein
MNSLQVLLLLFCACLPMAERQEVRKNPAASVTVVTSIDGNIFPESWLSHEIDAKAEPLHEVEIQRSKLILSSAMDKYPRSVLTSNLKTIYVMHRLQYSGISAGGTNSRDNVYLANRGERDGFTDNYLEGSFHHEFSSILLRNFPKYLEKKAWGKVNGDKFRYGKSGVAAVQGNRAGDKFDPSLNSEGFLCEYAKSTLENDFNVIAEQLFLGNPKFWSVVDKYPGIKKKTDLAIDFYRKIDCAFGEEYFRSLAKDSSPLNLRERSSPALNSIIPCIFKFPVRYFSVSKESPST